MQDSCKYFIFFISAIVLSALCFFWGTEFNSIWILAWFAPFPILLFGLYARNILHAFLASFMAYALGSLNIFYYFHYLPRFIFARICISQLLFLSLFYSLLILISCYVIRKVRSGWSVFFFPCLFVCYEYVMSAFLSSGTLNSIAYSQVKFLPLLQITSIFGILGVSFMLSLVSSSLAVSWYKRQDKYSLLISLFLPVCILLLVLGFGVFRLTHVKNAEHVKIGLLVAPESFQDITATDSRLVKVVVGRFLQEIPNLKKQGASIIVMPEKIVTTLSSYHENIIALFKHAARKNSVTLVFGINRLDKNIKANVAYVVSKKGLIVSKYYKRHMLPGPETGYEIGHSLSIFPANTHYAGIMICKDADFVNPGLQYSQNGVGLLIIPALDFVIDGWLHATPAIVRGVEGGYSVVRVAQWGLLSVTDQYGHVLGEKKTSSLHIVSLVTSVPISVGNTFYSKHPDVLALLAIIVALLLLMKAAWKSPKRHI